MATLFPMSCMSRFCFLFLPSPGKKKNVLNKFNVKLPYLRGIFGTLSNLYDRTFLRMLICIENLHSAILEIIFIALNFFKCGEFRWMSCATKFCYCAMLPLFIILVPHSSLKQILTKAFLRRAKWGEGCIQ